MNILKRAPSPPEGPPTCYRLSIQSLRFDDDELGAFFGFRAALGQTPPKVSADVTDENACNTRRAAQGRRPEQSGRPSGRMPFWGEPARVAVQDREAPQRRPVVRGAYAPGPGLRSGNPVSRRTSETGGPLGLRGRKSEAPQKGGCPSVARGRRDTTTLVVEWFAGASSPGRETRWPARRFAESTRSPKGEVRKVG